MHTKRVFAMLLRAPSAVDEISQGRFVTAVYRCSRVSHVCGARPQQRESCQR